MYIKSATLFSLPTFSLHTKKWDLVTIFKIAPQLTIEIYDLLMPQLPFDLYRLIKVGFLANAGIQFVGSIRKWIKNSYLLSSRNGQSVKRKETLVNFSNVIKFNGRNVLTLINLANRVIDKRQAKLKAIKHFWGYVVGEKLNNQINLSETCSLVCRQHTHFCRRANKSAPH